jgi:DNA repair protein RadA/Sms
MSKVKTTFFCQNCGAQYAKWQGQCNSCKEWNTIEEIIQNKRKQLGRVNQLQQVKHQNLYE